LAFARGGKLFPVEKSTGYTAIDTSVSDVDTWRAMEKLVEKGKARALGISNFDQKGIEEIMNKCDVVSTPV
jgi:diketogulonate reductase-like aldo/keto reductase